MFYVHYLKKISNHNRGYSYQIFGTIEKISAVLYKQHWAYC